MEYVIESAALFNPSMVPTIDQADLPSGSVRFLMSLRATGEGRISSIVFRRGVVDANGRVSVDPPGRYSRPLVAVAPDNFEKDYFDRESHALGAWTGHTQATIGLLGDRFTRAQLSDAIDEVRTKASVSGKSEELNDALLALTRANYRLNLPPGADIVHMPEMDGFEVVQAIREARANHGGTSARHCPDRAFEERGPRALPGGRHGQFPDQANSARGTARGH
jgi:hypothetical protein